MDFHSSPFSRVYGTCLIYLCMCVWVDGFLLKQRETLVKKNTTPKREREREKKLKYLSFLQEKEKHKKTHKGSRPLPPSISSSPALAPATPRVPRVCAWPFIPMSTTRQILGLGLLVFLKQGSHSVHSLEGHTHTYALYTHTQEDEAAVHPAKKERKKRLLSDCLPPQPRRPLPRLADAQHVHLSSSRHPSRGAP